MEITDTRVQAAVDAVPEVDWVRGLFGTGYSSAQEVMRDALSAALSAAPVSAEPQPVAVALSGEFPERIWAGDFDENGFGHCVAGMQGGLYEEYVRADSIEAPPDLAAESVRLREALEEITAACEEDCGVPTAADEDDEAVGAGQNQDGSIKPMALTFGMLRRARAALADQKAPRHD